MLLFCHTHIQRTAEAVTRIVSFRDKKPRIGQIAPALASARFFFHLCQFHDKRNALLSQRPRSRNGNVYPVVPQTHILSMRRAPRLTPTQRHTLARTPNSNKHTHPNTNKRTPKHKQTHPNTNKHTPNTNKHTPNTNKHTPNTNKHTPNTPQTHPKRKQTHPKHKQTHPKHKQTHTRAHTIHTHRDARTR